MIQKFEYDLENPPQYKSPDSTNVYTIIARRVVGEDVQEIGMNLVTSGGNLQVRFCVFAGTQPKMEYFSFRYNSKEYTLYPQGDEPVKRVGCSLDLFTIPVVTGPGVTRQTIMNALEADEGWDKLSSWVQTILQQEGFELAMDPGAFVPFWPKMLQGVGLEAPVVDIKYPGPLTKKKAPAAKAAHASDGDYDEDDNDDD